VSAANDVSGGGSIRRFRTSRIDPPPPASAFAAGRPSPPQVRGEGSRESAPFAHLETCADNKPRASGPVPSAAPSNRCSGQMPAGRPPWCSWSGQWTMAKSPMMRIFDGPCALEIPDRPTGIAVCLRNPSRSTSDLSGLEQ